MLTDILKTVPAILAGVLSLGFVALRIIEFTLVYRIYKNTKKPVEQAKPPLK